LASRAEIMNFLRRSGHKMVPFSLLSILLIFYITFLFNFTASILLMLFILISTILFFDDKTSIDLILKVPKKLAIFNGFREIFIVSMLLIIYLLMRIWGYEGSFAIFILVILLTCLGKLIIDFMKLLSKETYIIRFLASYLIGFLIMSLLGMLFTLIGYQNTYNYLFLFVIIITFITLAFLYFILRRKQMVFITNIKLSIKFFDLLLLFSIFVIFGLSFFQFYPSLLMLPGLDINFHYTYANTLFSTKLNKPITPYILFHLFLIFVQKVSGQNDFVTIFQALYPFVALLPLAYYEFNSMLLGSRKKAFISTMFFILYSNIFFLIYYEKIFISSAEALQSLYRLEASLFNSRFNWVHIVYLYFSEYIPAVTSFLLSLYLIIKDYKQYEAVEKSYLILFILFVFIAFLSHLIEAVLLGILIGVLIFLKKVRRSYVISYMISLVIINIFILYSNGVFTFKLQVFVTTAGIIFWLSLMTGLRKYIDRKLFMKLHLMDSFKYVLAIFLVIIYYFLTLVGLIVVQDFNFWNIAPLGIVPWYLYSGFLGFVGLLAISSISSLDGISFGDFLVLTFVLLIILGRFISFINLNLIYLSIHEGRLLGYIIIFMSPLAAYALAQLLDNHQITSYHARVRAVQIIASFALCFLTVFYSFGGYVLSFTYWKNMIQTYKMDELDFSLINFARSLNGSFVIPPTRTELVMTHVGLMFPDDIFSYFLFLDRSPSSLLSLYRIGNISNLYLVLSKNDLNIFKDSFIISHLQEFSTLVYTNNKYYVFKINYLGINETSKSLNYQEFRGWMKSFEVNGSLLMNFTTSELKISFNKTNIKVIYFVNGNKIEEVAQDLEIDGNCSVLIYGRIEADVQDYSALTLRIINLSYFEIDNNTKDLLFLKIQTNNITKRIKTERILLHSSMPLYVQMGSFSDMLSISMNGQAKLYALYDRYLLQQNGQDLYLFGKAQMKLLPIGGYILIKSLALKATVERIPPVIKEPKFSLSILISKNAFISFLLLLPMLFLLMKIINNILKEKRKIV